MTEYEIYLPTTQNDGSPIDPAQIEQLKLELAKAFGGYTHLRQRSEGSWSVGGVTFRDEITIVRVLDTGGASFDMAAFKKSTEEALRQENVLIVERTVRIVS
ncbi:MAG: hypothetical protein JWL90_1824 [Chthoniobacteraceae bacterium]|nr:hypothetical protein [Chthoniobacteraceae bacterium]